jgi:hypothetical protein
MLSNLYSFSFIINTSIRARKKSLLPFLAGNTHLCIIGAPNAIYQPEFKSTCLSRCSRNRCRTSPYNFTEALVVACHVCSCSRRFLLLPNSNSQELHFKRDRLEPPFLFSTFFLSLIIFLSRVLPEE